MNSWCVTGPVSRTVSPGDGDQWSDSVHLGTSRAKGLLNFKFREHAPDAKLMIISDVQQTGDFNELQNLQRQLMRGNWTCIVQGMLTPSGGS